jgi:hypothetical protein
MRRALRAGHSSSGLDRATYWMGQVKMFVFELVLTLMFLIWLIRVCWRELGF